MNRVQIFGHVLDQLMNNGLEKKLKKEEETIEQLEKTIEQLEKMIPPKFNAITKDQACLIEKNVLMKRAILLLKEIQSSDPSIPIINEIIGELQKIIDKQSEVIERFVV